MCEDGLINLLTVIPLSETVKPILMNVNFPNNLTNSGHILQGIGCPISWVYFGTSPTSLQTSLKMLSSIEQTILLNDTIVVWIWNSQVSLIHQWCILLKFYAMRRCSMLNWSEIWMQVLQSLRTISLRLFSKFLNPIFPSSLLPLHKTFRKEGKENKL